MAFRTTPALGGCGDMRRRQEVRDVLCLPPVGSEGGDYLVTMVTQVCEEAGEKGTPITGVLQHTSRNLFWEQWLMETA